MDGRFFMVNKDIIGLFLIALNIIFLLICIIEGITEDMKEKKARDIRNKLARRKASRSRLEADEKKKFLKELYRERYEYENTKGNDFKLYC